MTGYRWHHLILVFLLLSFSTLITAQRPKVGLVLSGGGAKGISHIGILQAIDSAGLKIDYLTGTSMGSVVGGLYSIGYSGNQLEELVSKLDWDVLLSNKPHYGFISIDEKDEYGQYSAEIGLKNLKPQIATGLIESEELWITLNELFLPVYDVKDFSKFNIPFKCLAMDLATGEALVMSKGEIVTAIRSSMAIPSVFTAVEYDSTKLVDGGLIRNFPVRDVKEMGADIVIGVNLFPGLFNVSQLNTALDVFYQVTQYRDAEDLIEEKKMCDLIIEPPLDGYSAGSFADSDAIMKIGKETAKLYYPYFKHLADSLNSLYPIEYNPHNRLPAVDSVIIEEIEVLGIQNTSKSLLLDKINIQTGKAYAASQINYGFRNAYSSRYYDNVYYELIPTKPGYAKLKCYVKEALLTQMKAGFSFHSFTEGSIIANLTVRNLFLDKSRTMVKASVGHYFRLLAQHKQAFGRKANNYINLSYSMDNLPLNVYEDSEKKYVYDVRYTEFNLNYTKVLGLNLSLSAGLEYQHRSFSPEVAADVRVDGTAKNFYAYLQSKYLTTNRRNFPTCGTDFTVEAGVVFERKADIIVHDGASSSVDQSDMINNKPEFYRIKINLSRHHPLNNKLVLLYNIQTGLTIHSQEFIFDNFYIGGIQPIIKQQVTFVGLNEGQITTSSCASALLGLQYNLSGNLFVLGRANTMLYDFSSEKTFYDADDAEWVNGFSLGLGYNLSALPLEFNVMYSPEIEAFYRHIKIGFIF
ncbi:MAG: patatin-like phospholipase family protein [Bacteroidia bacterium]|nr:patatin-like phospholipase family protein [Bacteroidia bacterium]